jgi:hypothetical protein
MPLALPDLPFKAPRILSHKRQRNWSRVLILASLLIATSTWAQGPVVSQSNPSYPAELQVTFQWNYSCPAGVACMFRCSGAGYAEHVSQLDVYLGTLPIDNAGQRAPAIFYDFSTREFPHGNGFSISTGVNNLSCQVTGLSVDYSGPPPVRAKPHSSGDASKFMSRSGQ